MRSEIKHYLEEKSRIVQFRDSNRQNAFVQYMNAIEHMCEYDDVDKYKLVFIGQPGKGKTTIIVNWLNLLFENKLNRSSADSVSLLTTRSGRTTIAEVHIKQTDGQSSLEIEPMDEALQCEYIKRYCKYLWESQSAETNADEDTETTDNTQENTHAEIDRAIQNMAGELLKQPNLVDSDDEWDENYLKRFGNMERFTECVLEKIDVHNRKTRIIKYERGDFKRWLHKTFDDVNYGKNPEVSLPQKIFINISASDLRLNLPPYINEVVDTIGIDDVNDFDDNIRSLIRSKDTICVFVDSVEGVPSVGIRSILRACFLSRNDEFFSEKTGLIVRATAMELSSVNQAQGDSDMGEKIKIGEIKRKLYSDNIKYNVNKNVLFYDAHLPYTIMTRISHTIDEKTKSVKVRQQSYVGNYDVESANINRELFTKFILELYGRYRKFLNNKFAALSSQIDKLIEDEKNDSNQNISRLTSLKKQIEARKSHVFSRFPQNLGNSVIDRALKNTHWRTIKKMNDLYGGRTPIVWHKTIYDEAKKDMIEKAGSVMAVLEREVIEAMEECDFSDSAIINGFLERLYSDIQNYIEKIGNDSFTYLMNDVFAPLNTTNAFWNTVQNISGTGYKNRVISCYERYIERENVNSGLNKIMLQATENVIDGLLAQFETKVAQA